MHEFDKTLTLTSPYISRSNVRLAQGVLKGENTFKNSERPIATYTGEIDGIYGPKTAAAARLAKHWLGYLPADVDDNFGQKIYDFLKGYKPLPISYVHRREELIAEEKQNMPAMAVDRAITFIGYGEKPPGSNDNKFGEWYGFNYVPWCAIFVSYCLWGVGYRTPEKSVWKYAYVPYIAADAEKGIHGMHFTTEPKKGDLVCYTFNGVKNAHVGFFEKWQTEGKTFVDIAGNTSGNNPANGGIVARGTYGIGLVTHFVRLT